MKITELINLSKRIKLITRIKQMRNLFQQSNQKKSKRNHSNKMRRIKTTVMMTSKIKTIRNCKIIEPKIR